MIILIEINSNTNIKENSNFNMNLNVFLIKTDETLLNYDKKQTIFMRVII
jgi:hypothetical protein